MRGQLTLTSFGYTGTTLGTLPDSIEPKVKTRPWEPYKVQPIRTTGTIKSVRTDASREWGRREIRHGGNHLDTVKILPVLRYIEATL